MATMQSASSAHPAPRPTLRRRGQRGQRRQRRQRCFGGQRGFSLILVFLLMILMLGTAGALLLTMQADLAVAGRDREAATALYAAEAGVAYAKDWLFGRPSGTGAGAWDAVLAGAGDLLCAAGKGAAPGTQPRAQTPRILYDKALGASYQFCFHNNAIDPNYASNPPAGDTRDGDGVLVIESYGFGPTGARTHLTVEVRNGAVAAPRGDDYSQGSSGALKQSSGEAGGPTQVGQGVTF